MGMNQNKNKNSKLKIKSILDYCELKVPCTENYRFQNREEIYLGEKYEISPEELKTIQLIKNTKVTLKEIPLKEKPIKVIIDTDIGTDLDDALALLFALHNDNINILGITTNYGPTNLRKEIASKICEIYFKNNKSKKAFPIIPGFPFPMGTHREFFFAGNEGKLIFNDEEINKLSGDWFSYDKKKKYNNLASDFIIKTCLENENITLISIGIPTNIGNAIKKNNNIISKIKEIVIMGGGSYLTKSNEYKIGKYSLNPNDWDKNLNEKSPFELPKNEEEANNFLYEGKPIILFPNHNFSGDTLATKLIFSTSNLNIRIIPHNVTSQFWLEGKSIDYLIKKSENFENDKLNNKLQSSSYVGLLLKAWFEVRGGNGGGQCPHDPLTIYEATAGGNQNHVAYVPGTLVVHEWAAYSTFVPHSDGKHLLGIEAKDVQGFLDKLEKGIIMQD